MASLTSGIIKSSVFRKQLVALTGLLMVGFVVGHLAGNTLIFLGHDAFNNYAKMLHELGELIWVARIGLLVSIVIHIVLTIELALENAKARGSERYAVTADHGDRSFATKTMKISGGMIFFFILLHLWDFTVGPERSIEESTGWYVLNYEGQHLFEYVWRSFTNPIRSGIYIIAVLLVGLHLSHAIESLFQTLGFNHDRHTPVLKKVSRAVGTIVGLGFASIPVYVMVSHYVFGVRV